LVCTKNKLLHHLRKLCILDKYVKKTTHDHGGNMKNLLTLVLLITLASCKTTTNKTAYSDSLTNFDIVIASKAKPEAETKKTFLLQAGKEDIDVNSPEFDLYATYLMKALESKNYVPATSLEEADVVITLSYGISKIRYLGGYNGFAGSNYYRSGALTNIDVNGKLTRSPAYEPRSNRSIYTNHYRYVAIAGYDLDKYKETEEQVQIWQTVVTSYGKSGHLDRVFPVMIGAATKHIGTDIRDKIRFTIRENDQRIKAIKEVSSIN